MDNLNKEKPKCPKCGSEKIKHYIYGLIRGPIPEDCILGGCSLDLDNPIIYCENCKCNIYVSDFKK